MMSRMVITFFRVFGYMKPLRKLYFLGSTFASFEVLMLFAAPELNRMLVLMVSDGNNEGTVRRIIFIVLGLVAFTPLVAIGKYWQAICAQKTADNLKKALFSHIQRLPLHELYKRQTGDYILRLTGDADRAGDLFRGFLVVALMRFTVVIAITMTLLLMTDWRIAVLCAIYSLICFILALFLNPFVNKLEQNSRKELSLALNVLLETVRSLPIVRVFMIVPVLKKRYRMRCEVARTKRVNFRTMSGVGYGIIDFFVFSARAVGFIFAIFLLSQGEISLEYAVYTASLMALSADAMLQLSAFILWSQPALVAAERIFEVIDIPCESLEKKKGISSLHKETREAVKLENVSFSYPDGTIALHHINLTIKVGEKWAIVGSSGGGKTTLAQIIASLYEPSKGDIKFYGMNRRELSLRDIRELIAYVPQDSMLFEGTIYENISGGIASPLLEHVEKAALSAGLGKFMLSLPQGYDTMVGEQGEELSGGQRQRVAIARAMFKGAPLLIFDEANSALDSDTEAYVQQSLSQLPDECTVIAVTHKLSTAKNVNKILVLEQGTIVESGSHKELISLGGRYAKLVSSDSVKSSMKDLR